MGALVSQCKCGDGFIKELGRVSASIIRKVFLEDSDTEICETTTAIGRENSTD